MNLVHRQYGGIQHYQQGLGLFGFLKKIKVGKWLKKAGDAIVNTVCSTVDSATFGLFHDDIENVRDMWTALAEKMVYAIDGPQKMKTAAAYEPTTAEQNILDNWAYNKLKPFAEKLAQEVGAASLLTDPQAKLNALNAIENKVNLAQDHIAVAETTGLSADALDIRQYLAYEALRPIDETIKAIISKMGVSVVQQAVSFSAGAYNMSPLYTSTIVTTVNGNNYKLGAGKNTTLIPSGTSATPGVTKTTTVLTKDGSLILQPLTNPNVKAAPVTDVPNGGEATGTPGKGSGKVWVIGGLIAAGIVTIAAIRKGKADKKKAKATK